MSPRTSRSTSKSLSIDGLAARHTITRRTPVRWRRAPRPWSPAPRRPPELASTPHHTHCRSRGSGSSGMSASHAARNPASNESPAPVVSTTRAGDRRDFGRLAGGRGDRSTAPVLDDDHARLGAEAPHGFVQIRDVSEAHRLHRVGQEDVGPRQQPHEPRVPGSRRVPIGVDRGRAAALVDPLEDPLQVGPESPLQEVRADVHVARRGEHLRIDEVRAETAGGAGGRQHRPVVEGREHHRDPRGASRIGDEPADVHAAGSDGVAHVAAEQVVTHDAASGQPAGRDVPRRRRGSRPSPRP